MFFDDEERETDTLIHREKTIAQVLVIQIVNTRVMSIL